MAEKYIDLAEQVIGGSDRSNTVSFRIGVEYAFEWLDGHPDQVPGQTITVSKFDEAVESCVTEDATVPPHTFAERLGVVCVPDPEPTNAEKLDKIMEEWPGRATASDPTFGEYLHNRGVRAPGGDDG